MLLRDALEKGPAVLNQLEREGVIRRFEYSFELAWKTVKDYMEAGGFLFSTVTPRQVRKDAFAARILADGQVWIDMLDHRNLRSHTHNQLRLEEAVQVTCDRYLGAIEQFHEFLEREALK